MNLDELKALVPGLFALSHAERIKIFGWYLHVHGGKDYFRPGNVVECYEHFHLAAPALGGHFASLERQKFLQRSKTGSGYKLAGPVREDLNRRYGQRAITVQIINALTSLPGQLPDLAERTYLEEALICFKHGAFRASVVMTWNLAYHHLCDYVVRKHLQAFNAAWQTRFPGDHKVKVRTLVKLEDFGESLKESKVLEICKAAGIVPRDVWKVLDAKLDVRNSAAHPSILQFSQVQAEEFIDSLITNAVLHLA